MLLPWAAAALAAVSAAPPTTAWKAPAWADPAHSHLRAEMATRLDRSEHRLREAPYTLPFILADVSFTEKRIFTEYSGDISGRMVGVVAAQIGCGREPSWPLADLLGGLAKWQQPDGHFGAPQDLRQSVTGERDMPILWGNGRLLVGLVEAYRSSHNQQALDLARRLGDYYVRTDALLDRPELVSKFGNYASGYATCYFSGIEGLVALGNETRDRRYLDQAKRMAALMRSTTKLGETHSHGRLCALRGLLDLYETTGDRSYLADVEAEHAEIRAQYLWPTGGISEMMVTSFSRNEGCTEADWLRLNLQLWRLTGRDLYLDLAERTLLNEMAVDQFPNGGFGHRVTARADGLMDGYLSVAKQGTQEAYWCCSEHGPRALMEVAPALVAARGREVYVNFYEPADAEVKVAGATVRVTVEPTPARDGATVSVACSRPTDFTLHLRVPAWAEGLEVSGETAPAKRDAAGRVMLTRRWPSASTVAVRMPLRLYYHADADPLTAHVTDASSAPASAVLYRGPFLLGRPAADTGAASAADALRPVYEFAVAGEGFRLRAPAK